MHLRAVIEIEEPGLANRCIGPIEVLRHGRKDVFDPPVAACVYLLTADDNELRACDLRATNMAAGHHNLLERG